VAADKKLLNAEDAKEGAKVVEKNGGAGR